MIGPACVSCLCLVQSRAVGGREAGLHTEQVPFKPPSAMLWAGQCPENRVWVGQRPYDVSSAQCFLIIVTGLGPADGGISPNLIF